MAKGLNCLSDHSPRASRAHAAVPWTRQDSRPVRPPTDQEPKVRIAGVRLGDSRDQAKLHRGRGGGRDLALMGKVVGAPRH